VLGAGVIELIAAIIDPPKLFQDKAQKPRQPYN
jgi:hypothetical protein